VDKGSRLCRKTAALQKSTEAGHVARHLIKPTDARRALTDPLRPKTPKIFEPWPEIRHLNSQLLLVIAAGSA